MQKFIILGLALSLAACGTGDKDDSDGGNGGGAASGADIGTPLGDPIAVDHERASLAVRENLTNHMNELDEALTFFEESDLIESTLDMVFGGGEEDDVDGPGEPGDPEPPMEEEDEGIEIDLSGALEDILEFIEEELMRSSAAETSEDGLSVTYLIPVEAFCGGDEEEMEGEGDFAAPVEPEEEGGEGHDDEGDDDADGCVEQLTETPLRIRATSHAEGAVDLELLVGADRLSVLRVQIHADRIAVRVDLAKIKQAAELIWDGEDDLDLPDVITGVIGVEVKREAAKHFTVRVALVSAIQVSDAGDNPMTLTVAATPSLAALELDGNNKTITGSLGLGQVAGTAAWQDVVDFLHGGTEMVEVCDGPPGEEHCWEEEGEPTEPPTVQGTAGVSLAGISGSMTFGDGDTGLGIDGAGLGDAPTTVTVNGDTLIAVNLNKDQGRQFDLGLSKAGDAHVRVTFSPGLELAVTFAMKHIEDVFEDLPDMLRDETLGLRLDGAAAPAIQSVGESDDPQMQVASGQLTLFSSAMDEDIVIGEGMCLSFADAEESTPGDVGEPIAPDADEPPAEVEEEDGHDLFGGFEAATCG